MRHKTRNKKKREDDCQEGIRTATHTRLLKKEEGRGVIDKTGKEGKVLESGKKRKNVRERKM